MSSAPPVTPAPIHVSWWAKATTWFKHEAVTVKNAVLKVAGFAPEITAEIVKIAPTLEAVSNMILPDWWKNGGSLISCNYQREIPEAKTINYLRSVRWSQRLLETKAAEILYLDRNWVRECSRSNIFYVKDQIVYTPKSMILAGVTRKRILQLPGFTVEQRNFKMKELLEADEVFITSTTKGVLPIVKIDSTVIGDGRIGMITKAIREAIQS